MPQNAKTAMRATTWMELHVPSAAKLWTVVLFAMLEINASFAKMVIT